MPALANDASTPRRSGRELDGAHSGGYGRVDPGELWGNQGGVPGPSEAPLATTLVPRVTQVAGVAAAAAAAAPSAMAGGGTTGDFYGGLFALSLTVLAEYNHGS